jgi:hypothetical protein
MARPAFQPTDAMRRQVEAFVAYGATHDEIAGLVGCAPKTLRRHFRAELDRGDVQARMKVAESLMLQAVGAPAVYDEEGRELRKEQPRVVAAGIFWMKTRARWRDTNHLELTGANGGPVQHVDLTKATDEQLSALEALFGPIAGAGGDDEGDPGRESAPRR